MPRIEIDENEYAELTRVAKVAQSIGAHPKAREMLQQAVALAVPDQAGPEIRIRQELTERIGGIEKTIGDFITSQKTEREEQRADEARRALENRWTESRGKARSAGYTEEGLTELESFMEKNGVADHELAIPAFERLHPPPEPVVSGGSRWNFFDQNDQGAAGGLLKQLMDSQGQDENAIGGLINVALKDVRGR